MSVEKLSSDEAPRRGGSIGPTVGRAAWLPAAASLRRSAAAPDPFVRQRRLAMRHHLLLLCGATAVIAVASCLRLEDASHVRVAGTAWVLPELCSVRRYLGVPCPGCGLTRSFVCLARGDLAAAWHFNPAGLLLFGLVVVQFPYRVVQLRRLATRKRELDWDLLPWVAIFVGFAMLAQWIWRMVPQLL